MQASNSLSPLGCRNASTACVPPTGTVRPLCNQVPSPASCSYISSCDSTSRRTERRPSCRSAASQHAGGNRHFTGHGRQRVQTASAKGSEFDLDAEPVDVPGMEGVELGPREDEVLPDSLSDAVADAAAATADAIRRSSNKCQVEILMPEFWDPSSGPIFPNRGDQERFWAITRRFIELLASDLKLGNVRAIYPDAGVAAMLTHQWQDRSFRISSLNDRKPVSADDGLVVIACPDPPGAEECRRVVRQLGEQDEETGAEPRPIVLFNQRLAGGDIGVGLNARRMRDAFLQPFIITYSLRPYGEVGSVFRKYPGMWKVFVEEEKMPGRYRLIKETPSRPQGEMLDFMIREALGEGPPGEGEEGGNKSSSVFNSLRSTLGSLQYFMKSLSK